jgi:hypothetical protein
VGLNVVCFAVCPWPFGASHARAEGNLTHGLCLVALGGIGSQSSYRVVYYASKSWCLRDWCLHLVIVAQAILKYTIPGTVGVG